MQEYKLERFIIAQENLYSRALSEVKNGRKQSHWMWFIFPQVAGLGWSETSQFYAISGIDEAAAYLAHAILGPRLREISNILLTLPENNPTAIFGSPDDMKLRSSMTLFAQIEGADKVFQHVLDKFFGEEPDPKTLQILGE